MRFLLPPPTAVRRALVSIATCSALAFAGSPAAAADSPPASPTWTVSPTFRWVVARGLLPRTSPGWMVASRVRLSSHFDAHLGVLWMTPQAAEDDALNMQFGAVRVGGCVNPWSERALTFRLCGSAWVGSLRSSFRESKALDPGTHPWAAASPELLLTWRLAKHLELSASAEAVVPIFRDTFLAYRRPVTGFRQPVVAGVASVGVAWPF